MSENRKITSSEYTLLTLFNYLKKNWVLLLSISGAILILAFVYISISPTITRYETVGYLSLKSSGTKLPFNLYKAKELVDSGALSEEVLKASGKENGSRLSFSSSVNDKGNSLRVSLQGSNAEDGKLFVSELIRIMKESAKKDSATITNRLNSELAKEQKINADLLARLISLKQIKKGFDDNHQLYLANIKEQQKSLVNNLEKYRAEKDQLSKLLRQLEKKDSPNTSLDLLLVNINQINSQISKIEQDLLDLPGAIESKKYVYLKSILENSIMISSVESSLAEKNFRIAELKNQIDEFESAFDTQIPPVTSSSSKGPNTKIILAIAFLSIFGLIVILSYLTWLLKKAESTP